MKHIIIAGSREYTHYEEAKAYIIQCLQNMKISIPFTILSGGCRGADLLGEQFANDHHLPIKRYLPDWNTYGKAACPIRNRTMVDACDAVICFWDEKSRGTKSLINYARKQQKPLFIFVIKPQPKI